MKKVLLSQLILFSGLLNAQQYGAQWVLGENTSVLDFRNVDTVGLYSIPSSMAFFLTTSCICNGAGNLLYFTNGIYIANKNGDSLFNGTGLNPCPYTEAWAGSGLNIPQAALFIPKPGDTSEYYLLHFSRDTNGGNLPGTLYYSQIRDSALGYVVQKNIPFGKGIFRSGGMTACKHANGRDYWVIMGLDGSNEYFKYLFTPDTILGPFTQNIGPNFGGFDDLPYSKFSQDGSKYATGIYGGAPILVMDFDRCSGEFTNPITIYNYVSTDTAADTSSGCASLEFSANGQFLYVGDVFNISQYDLSSPNFQDSLELYRAADTDLYYERDLQLAPNGKLYASTWNGGVYFIHVINYPDQKGDSCDFVYEGQPTLTRNSINLPNQINYKLGPLTGSGCDTIVIDTSKDTTGVNLNTLTNDNSLLRILPNPADKYIYVEIGTQGNYEFQLWSEMGQLIDKKETRQIDIFDTESLANGVYFIKAIDKNDPAQLIAKQIVIQH